MTEVLKHSPFESNPSGDANTDFETGVHLNDPAPSVTIHNYTEDSWGENEAPLPTAHLPVNPEQDASSVVQEEQQNKQDQPWQHKLEIRHIGTQDFIFNSTYPNKQKQDELFYLIQDGVPPEWAMDTGFKVLNLDNKEKPRFIGKRGPSYYELEEMKYYMGLQEVHALQSIVKEISLAPVVKQIVGSEEVQWYAKDIGFNGIQYVEPILGVIDKKNGEKRKFYEYVQASRYGSPFRPGRKGIVGQVESGPLIHAIKAKLNEQNIVPSELMPMHLMVSTHTDPNPNMLYLIDAENYFKVSNRTKLEEIKAAPYYSEYVVI